LNIEHSQRQQIATSFSRFARDPFGVLHSSLLILHLSKIPLFLQFIHHLLQLPVPNLAKAADERLLQELIDADATFFAQGNGIFADFPSVIVETRQATHFLLAYGIEVTTDGALSQQTALRATKAAVATAYDTGYQFTFRIGIGYALFVYHRLSLSIQAWPYIIQLVLYVSNLVERNRRSGISFLAATAFALLDVAAEKFRYYVGMHNYIAHHKHRGQFLLTTEWAAVHAEASIGCTG
jgi:hypothetical protein